MRRGGVRRRGGRLCPHQDWICNCATGVSDDIELERVSDFSLVGGELQPLDVGHPAAMAWMKGRARAYVITSPAYRGKGAISAAFNDHCDAVVATIVLPQNRSAAIEPRVFEFLGSGPVLAWAKTSLGL